MAVTIALKMLAGTVVQRWPLLADLDAWLHDRLMVVNAQAGASLSGSSPRPSIVFVDFDQPSLDSLSRSDPVPRDTVVSVVLQLLDTEARFIAVDWQWRRRDSVELARLIGSYRAKAAKSNTVPQLALAMDDALWERIRGQDTATAVASRLQRVSLQTTESTLDGVVRFWTACDSLPIGLPTMAHALAQAMATAGAQQRAVGDELTTCQRGVPREAQSRRILYGAAWVATSITPSPTDAEFTMLRVPAHTVLRASTRGQLAGAFSDHVVVVGTSASTMGDVHPTPVGLMPGAVIAVEAARSMLRWSATSGRHSRLYWVMFASLTIVLSLVEALGYGMWLSFSSVLAVGVIVLPLALQQQPRGEWISLTVPLLGALLHSWMHDVVHGVTSLWEKLRSMEGPHEG